MGTNGLFTQCEPFQKYCVAWIIISSKIILLFAKQKENQGFGLDGQYQLKKSIYFKLEMVSIYIQLVDEILEYMIPLTVYLSTISDI